MPGLSRENLEKQSTPNSKGENLEVKKSIEIEEELIEESGLPADEWIENYGKRFREIIKEKPELLSDIDKAREELYKEKIH